MSLKLKFNHAAKLFLALTLSFACPPFLSPQTKKTTPAPAPKSAPAKSAPAKSSPSSAPKTQSRSSSGSSARSSSRSSSGSSRSSSRTSSRSSSASSAQRQQQRQAQKQQQQQAKNQQKQQRQAQKQQQQQAKNQQKQQRQAQKQQQQQAKNQQKQQREAQKQQQQQAKNQQAAGPVPGQKSASTGPRAAAKTVTTPAGHQLSYNNSGQLQAMTTNRGTVANFNAHGQVSTIRTANGTTITRGPGGTRTIQSEHISPNGGRYQVVSTGAHAGYVQHTFSRGGQAYVSRTYVSPGRTYVAVYHNRFYGGRSYFAYAPGFYYGPAFYGWAYDPWLAPAYYSWGWYGDPWYTPYGYYFSPYAVYPSAAFWLTDYVVSESLRSAFEARTYVNAEASAETSAPNYQPEAQNNDVTLTPQIKQMIADEVKAELAAERAEAQISSIDVIPAPAPGQGATDSALLPALDPNVRVFIVAENLEVSVNGQACSLSAGDVLNRLEDAPDSSNTVAVSVVSSQKSDCRMGSSPRLEVADLQEMHNRFREKLDSGLRNLADNQGNGGIPSGPAAGRLANPNGTVEAELGARAEIESQSADADQAEKEVQQAQAAPASSGGNNK